VIPVDSDTEDQCSTLQYLQANPLISRYASFIYTTISHRPEKPRARGMFVLDKPITDPDYYRQAKRAVFAQLPWVDQSVNEPARLFYGSKDCGSLWLGNILPLVAVDQLIEAHRAMLEQERRQIPEIDPSRIMGDTPAERYAERVMQEEAAWLASRVEGTGERHRGLLIAAMKLESLRLADWLPMDIRESINPYALLMPATQSNGYWGKYGEKTVRQTIADGIGYAKPRPIPESWATTTTPKPRVWRVRGGHLKVEVVL
jgi:hypothetical protein